MVTAAIAAEALSTRTIHLFMPRNISKGNFPLSFA
jgi:hypothetical protein